jgi:transcriptional regulator with XRE-family HTH domain
MMRRLPKARRERVMARASEIREEIEGLQSLRKAATKTQAQVARALGVSQPSVAKIEKQADMYLSTLRSYVEATGGTLELVVRLKDGHRIALSRLADVPRARKGAERHQGRAPRLQRGQTRA